MGGGQRSPWADYSKNCLLRDVSFLLPLKYLHWLLAAVRDWKRQTTSSLLCLPPAARPEHLPTCCVPSMTLRLGFWSFLGHQKQLLGWVLSSSLLLPSSQGTFHILSHIWLREVKITLSCLCCCLVGFFGFFFHWRAVISPLFIAEMNQN